MTSSGCSPIRVTISGLGTAAMLGHPFSTWSCRPCGERLSRAGPAARRDQVQQAG
jgi:hypothetical protein